MFFVYSTSSSLDFIPLGITHIFSLRLETIDLSQWTYPRKFYWNVKFDN